MAGVKISQLTSGGTLQPTDIFPVARGNFTRGILGSQLLDPLQNLQTQVQSLQSLTAVNVVDSSTIDLNWNSSTRTLSANANNLLTLINQLSTNMQNIGNYPYLEYAWVTAANSSGLVLPHNTFTTLTLNTEVTDTANFGSLNTNLVTLSSGTYRYEALARVQPNPWTVSSNSPGETLLYFRVYTGSTILGEVYGGLDNVNMKKIDGQFSLTTNSPVGLAIRPFNYDSWSYIINNSQNRSYIGTVNDSSTNLSSRVIFKLWKVG